jgi:hypothetical protein
VAGELGVRAEALDRSDLAEQLGRGECSAARKLEEPWCGRLRLGVQLTLERCDRAGEAATARQQLTGDPDLGRLLAAGELAAEPLQPDGSVERAERVELV